MQESHGPTFRRTSGMQPYGPTNCRALEGTLVNQGTKRPIPDQENWRIISSILTNPRYHEADLPSTTPSASTKAPQRNPKTKKPLNYGPSTPRIGWAQNVKTGIRT